MTVQRLQTVLQKLNAQLDQERKEKENLKQLQEQIEDNQAILRERLLFKLVVGSISPAEAVEKGQLLGLDLIARYYLAVVLKLELKDRTEPYDHDEYQRLQQVLTELAEMNPDVFLLKKEWGDTILILKGSTLEYLEEDRDVLLEEIRRTVAGSRYQVCAGVGSSKEHIADICQSFVEALVHLQNSGKEQGEEMTQSIEQRELLKLDKAVVEDYLRCGSKESFEEFFNAYLRPLSESTLRSPLIKNYVFVDVLLATAKLVDELGGEVDKMIPGMNSMETILSNVRSVEQLRQEVCRIISIGLEYRDSHPNGQHAQLIRQAKDYIEEHYADPELCLNRVAARANLSASHFSTVFSQETGQTFKEYLTEIRMHRAKELLRMTMLRSAEIAYQVGYNDPHYFSAVFKKNTGLSPMEFRSRA